eukprot:gene12028-biopygen13984
MAYAGGIRISAGGNKFSGGSVAACRTVVASSASPLSPPTSRVRPAALTPPVHGFKETQADRPCWSDCDGWRRALCCGVLSGSTCGNACCDAACARRASLTAARLAWQCVQRCGMLDAVRLAAGRAASL